MSETLQPGDKDKKNGRFVPGNSGGPGRKPGSRNRLGEQFLSDLRDVWNERGADALVRCCNEDPTGFIKVIAGLLPRSIDINVAIDPLAFADKFRAALVMLGNEEEAALPRKPLRNAPKVIDHD